MDEMTDVWAKLGAQMKKARGSRTQKEVADKLNEAMGTSHHPTVITKIENGKRPLSFVEAIHLARILHVDPETMIETIGARDETAEWDEIHGWSIGLEHDALRLRESVERLGRKTRKLLDSPASATATEWVALCRASGEKILEELRAAHTYVDGAVSKFSQVNAETDRRGWEYAPDLDENGDYIGDAEATDDGSA